MRYWLPRRSAPDAETAVSLSVDEQRRLGVIAAMLAADDPALARRLRRQGTSLVLRRSGVVGSLLALVTAAAVGGALTNGPAHPACRVAHGRPACVVGAAGLPLPR